MTHGQHSSCLLIVNNIIEYMSRSAFMHYLSAAEYEVLNKWCVVLFYFLSFSVCEISFILHWLVNLWEERISHSFSTRNSFYYCFLLYFGISRLIVSLSKIVYKLLFQL